MREGGGVNDMNYQERNLVPYSAVVSDGIESLQQYQLFFQDPHDFDLRLIGLFTPAQMDAVTRQYSELKAIAEPETKSDDIPF